MKTLKVGFDLDGVILYNPIRIFRPIIYQIKKIFFPKRKEIFYIPQSRFDKFIFKLLHKTSFMIDKEIKELKRLVKNKKIKFYLITGRYNFLKDDYERWLKKLKAEKIFVKCFYNKNNQQPYQFKKNLIKKLKLDFYVEDNFDIVKKIRYLKKTKILWLTNIFDKNISYPFKFLSLKEVCQFLKKAVSKNQTSLD